MMEGVEVTSRRGAVSATPGAARIGVEILDAGGNAFDVAVATALACGMLEPNQTGIGGYAASAVLRDGATGELWSVDGDAAAPAGAHDGLYDILPPGTPGPGAINESEYACSVRDNANVHGGLSVATPGLLAAVGTIHERWGRLPWAAVLAPSQRLLADGFPYGEVAGAIARMLPVLERFPASLQHLMPAGRLPTPEDIWHRPDMEITLARLAREGWRDFYTGQLGGQIIDHLECLGGLLSRADLAAYAPRVEPPHLLNYHGARIAGACLPNGSFTPLQALAMLHHLELPGEDSAGYFHLLGEVLKVAWRDRLTWLADPAFEPIPIARLLSPDYTAGRVEAIRQNPLHVDLSVPPETPNPPTGTRHVSAADSEGNLISLTVTQGGTFGSCVTVPGTGIILGHGMCRFDPRPGRRNSVRAGRRMLNNMCPMLVDLPDRIAAFGLPGGRLIVSVTTRALQLIVDRGYSVRQAAIAPRFHVETAEPLYIDKAIAPELRDELRAMGHRVKGQGNLAGPLHGAEYLKAGPSIRAGSSTFAAASEQ